MKAFRGLYTNQMYSQNEVRMRGFREKFVKGRVLIDNTCFFKCDQGNYVNGGLLISVQKKKVMMVNRPVLCSASRVSECEKELDCAEAQTQETCESEKVRVKVQLQNECAFGENFFIVGDDPMLGSWNPEEAIPLDWSEEHIWSVELDITVEKTIQFKLLLKGNMGNMLWQPGPDRVLQTWETDKTITVLEDWENADMQKIGEERMKKNEEKMEDLKNESQCTVGNNGNSTEATRQLTSINDLLVISDEDGPVLVPGLTPLETEEETTVYQNGTSISVNDTLGPDEPEARTGTPLELNERPREENMAILLREEELFGIELQQNPEVDRVKEQLQSDMKWFSQTLQKLLSNLGIGWHQ